MPDEPKPSLSTLTTSIVVAFVRNHQVQLGDLPALIATVDLALAGAGGPAPVPPQAPAANLRRLVTAVAIVCAECGGRFKSIKRHLSVAHGLTPSTYRAKWGLKQDHPMVAPDYAAARSQLAKSAGLGRKPAARPAKALAKVAKVSATDRNPAAAKTSRKQRAARTPKSTPSP